MHIGGVGYQQSSVVHKPRSLGPDVQVFRYMERSNAPVPTGTVDKFKTKAAARKHGRGFQMRADRFERILRPPSLALLRRIDKSLT